MASVIVSRKNEYPKRTPMTLWLRHKNARHYAHAGHLTDLAPPMPACAAVVG
jgi:hypothetical protein